MTRMELTASVTAWGAAEHGGGGGGSGCYGVKSTVAVQHARAGGH